MVLAINKLFNRKINHTRIKNLGNKAKIRTIIKEEPIKLAQYLRGNKSTYEPIISIKIWNNVSTKQYARSM